MAWVASYQGTCAELGVEDDELRLPAEAGRGIGTLVTRYTGRVHGLLTTWYHNILEVGPSTPSLMHDSLPISCKESLHRPSSVRPPHVVWPTFAHTLRLASLNRNVWPQMRIGLLNCGCIAPTTRGAVR